MHITYLPLLGLALTLNRSDNLLLFLLLFTGFFLLLCVEKKKTYGSKNGE